jgi:uncharacterized membrane protein
VSIFSSYSFGDVLFLWASLALGFPIAQAIGALYPVWAATAGWIFLGESLTTQKAFGMALAVLGTMVVVLLGARQEKKEKPPAHLPFLARYEVGVALALVASLAWAVNSFATGRGGQSMNAAFANVLRMSLALGLCGSLARWQGGKEARLFFDSADYLRYAPFFAIEAFLGSYLYMYGLSHSSVAVGATLSSLAPVASIPVAVFLGWEKFSGKTLLAMVVVVAGVVLLVA